MAHVFEKKWRSEDVRLQENVDFSALLLSDRVLLGLTRAGFKKPSPIQLEAIPMGRFGKDLLVQAKSGTGKTLVFVIVALEMFRRKLFRPQVLIVAPTREIATQIGTVIKSVGSTFPKLNCSSFIGGLPVLGDKEKAVMSQIIVGTPGRLRHLIDEKCLPTNSIRLLVFDEADQLLELNFKDDIDFIFNSLPEDKQVITTSATYAPRYKKMLQKFLRDPHLACLNSKEIALLGMVHYAKVVKYCPMPILQYRAKLAAVEEILKTVKFAQCLLFCNGVQKVEVLYRDIKEWGFSTAYISSAKEQNDRLKAIDRLKHFKCKVLVSSDVTSRGIDAENVDLVINFDLSFANETYFHRAGRAGRYGSIGVTISIMNERETKYLKNVEKLGAFKCYKLTDPIPTDLILHPPISEYIIPLTDNDEDSSTIVQNPDEIKNGTLNGHEDISKEENGANQLEIGHIFNKLEKVVLDEDISAKESNLENIDTIHSSYPNGVNNGVVEEIAAGESNAQHMSSCPNEAKNGALDEEISAEKSDPRNVVLIQSSYLDDNNSVKELNEKNSEFEHSSKPDDDNDIVVSSENNSDAKTFSEVVYTDSNVVSKSESNSECKKISITGTATEYAHTENHIKPKKEELESVVLSENENIKTFHIDTIKADAEVPKAKSEKESNDCETSTFISSHGQSVKTEDLVKKVGSVDEQENDANVVNDLDNIVKAYLNAYEIIGSTSEAERDKGSQMDENPGKETVSDSMIHSLNFQKNEYFCKVFTTYREDKNNSEKSSNKKDVEEIAHEVTSACAQVDASKLDSLVVPAVNLENTTNDVYMVKNTQIGGTHASHGKPNCESTPRPGSKSKSETPNRSEELPHPQPPEPIAQCLQSLITSQITSQNQYQLLCGTVSDESDSGGFDLSDEVNSENYSPDDSDSETSSSAISSDSEDTSSDSELDSKSEESEYLTSSTSSVEREENEHVYDYPNRRRRYKEGAPHRPPRHSEVYIRERCNAAAWNGDHCHHCGGHSVCCQSQFPSAWNCAQRHRRGGHSVRSRHLDTKKHNTLHHSRRGHSGHNHVHSCYLPSEHRCHPNVQGYSCDHGSYCALWYDTFYKQWLHIQSMLY